MMMERLTENQKKIARMRFDGKTICAIATELGRSQRTIKNTISAIYAKTGVNSVIELYKLDQRTGVINGKRCG
jgi:DNA-binding NarL/FixJ family response regulator